MLNIFGRPLSSSIWFLNHPEFIFILKDKKKKSWKGTKRWLFVCIFRNHIDSGRNKLIYRGVSRIYWMNFYFRKISNWVFFFFLFLCGVEESFSIYPMITVLKKKSNYTSSIHHSTYKENLTKVTLT